MASTLSVDILARLSWLQTEAADLSTVTDEAKLQYEQAVADGTAEDQADLLWHDERTIAAGANDDVDLTALERTIFGSAVTVNLAKVKALQVVNTAATSGHELRVGGAGAGSAFSAPFNGDADAVVEVGAESCLLLSSKKDGWSVTPGTGDILRIHNPGAAPVTYKIVLVGTSS